MIYSDTTILLENLLEWSRSQSGNINVNKQKININDILQSTITLLKPTAESKKIQIINTADKNQTIFADKNILSTIIRNLLSNALKFTHCCSV